LTTSTRNAGSVHAKPSARPAARPPVIRRNGKAPLRPPVTTVVAAVAAVPASANGKPEQKVLFQKSFKAAGPRNYVAQIKELGNGNHLLVLAEARRDAESGDVRKTRLSVSGEDLTAFFRLLHETATFIRANPVPEEVRKRREKYWAKKNRESRNNGSSSAE
jgi:Protein of unknown function (DUF3276)